jgi:transcriptional regulator with XRE-family HTH domain
VTWGQAGLTWEPGAESAAEPGPRPVYGPQCMVRLLTGERITGRPGTDEQAEIAVGLGRRLRMLRAGHRLSLRGLERRSGVSRAMLTRLEHGMRRPRESTLGWIAWACGPDDSVALKRDLCQAAGWSLLCDSRWSQRQHARQAFAALRGGLLPLPGWLIAGRIVAIFGSVMPDRLAELTAVQAAARRSEIPWPETAWSSVEALVLAGELADAADSELAQIGRAITRAGLAQAAYARRVRLRAAAGPVSPCPRRLPPAVIESGRRSYETAFVTGTVLSVLASIGDSQVSRNPRATGIVCPTPGQRAGGTSVKLEGSPPHPGDPPRIPALQRAMPPIPAFQRATHAKGNAPLFAERQGNAEHAGECGRG